MRGTLRISVRRNVGHGIIPAYAGNTSNVRSSMVSAWDHPRVCGEHILLSGLSCTSVGSSPRMRGTPRKRRFTTRSTVDHPRVCGEHWIDRNGTPQYLGSSPRMRGTPTLPAGSKSPSRIIPAYAGNTPRCLYPTCSCRDHPRVCGEHNIVFVPYNLYRGSSPRMRGTLTTIRCAPELIGIIPAYAGNTFRPCRLVVRGRDHPRVCGEHVCQYGRVHIERGSSPRMRGTLTPILSGSVHTGIIPAYAGNTYV